jgi:hypothetical protein
VQVHGRCQRRTLLWNIRGAVTKRLVYSWSSLSANLLVNCSEKSTSHPSTANYLLYFYWEVNFSMQLTSIFLSA